METTVILGTSRNESNTLAAVRKHCPFNPYKLIDLRDQFIRPFDYEQNRNRSDGFLEIAEQMLRSQVIVFATPVYWYSMSGVMKIFFDRLTDLTGIHKAIGKELRGKRTYLIASGASPQLPEGFELPFRQTSDYFDMEFLGTFYQSGS